VRIIINHLFIISEGECKCAQVRKHKAAHDKNNISHNIKNMYQKRNASAQALKSVNTKPRTIFKKKNHIVNTTFHYKYTNKES